MPNVLPASFRRLSRRTHPAQAEQLAREIDERGFCILEAFLPSEMCRALIDELDRLFDAYSDKIQRHTTEGTGSDYRLFGVEKASRLIKNAILPNPLINQTARLYMKDTSTIHMVLGGKLEYVEGRVCNSGGGWHRDSLTKQIKALIYLTDVTAQNRPFTIVEASRNLPVPSREDRPTRFDDDAVHQVLQQKGIQPLELTSPAGTCILVDT